MPLKSYTIRDFRGGISDENNRGIAGSFKFGYNLDIRSRANVLQCSQALEKESSTVVTDLINFIIPCSNGKAYGFGNAGCIYERSGTTWVKRYTDADGAIIGAAEWNGYLYWACDTEISRIQISAIPAATWTTEVAHDWQTTLTSAAWHTMLIASGCLMICNNKYLALIDNSGVFNATALNLYSGTIAKCLDEDGFWVIIGTVDAGNAEKGHLETWEPQYMNWVKKKKIASKGINGLITTEMMLMQAGVDGEVYFSDMVSKIPVFTFPDGGFVLPGGVCERKGLSMFGISGNSSMKCGIYSYGRAKKNFPFALNLDYVGSPGVITGIDYGAIEMVDGTLLVAWKYGSTYGVDALSTTKKANGVYEGLEWDGGWPMLKKTFKQTKIVMEPLPASCSVVLEYKINGASDWSTASTVDGSSSFSTENGVRALFNISEEGEVIELRAELTSSSNNSPKIKSINTYFEFSKMSKW